MKREYKTLTKKEWKSIKKDAKRKENKPIVQELDWESWTNKLVQLRPDIQ